jgi:hypothetical protein
MALSFVYLAFRALLGALVRCRRGVDVREIEPTVATSSGALSMSPVFDPRRPVA